MLLRKTSSKIGAKVSTRLVATTLYAEQILDHDDHAERDQLALTTLALGAIAPDDGTWRYHSTKSTQLQCSEEFHGFVRCTFDH
jgi:hypothetical protein